MRTIARYPVTQNRRIVLAEQDGGGWGTERRGDGPWLVMLIVRGKEHRYELTMPLDELERVVAEARAACPEMLREVQEIMRPHDDRRRL